MRDPINIRQSELKLRFIKPIKLAFIRARGAYAHSVGEAWEKMFDWIERRGHALTGGYGLAHDDPRATLTAKMRYDACVEIPSTWGAADLQFVQVATFDGGSFAVQRYRGPYSNIGQVISNTRREMLPKTNLALDRHRPILCVYHHDPRTVEPRDLETDVCLPVRADP